MRDTRCELRDAGAESAYTHPYPLPGGDLFAWEIYHQLLLLRRGKGWGSLKLILSYNYARSSLWEKMGGRRDAGWGEREKGRRGDAEMRDGGMRERRRDAENGRWDDAEMRRGKDAGYEMRDA